MRTWLLAGVVAAACGDNTPAVGPPLAAARSLLIVGHTDDDMIFMQPELLDALAAESLTTVYVTTGDPVKGDDHALHLFRATRRAYAKTVGAEDWDCGYVEVTGSPVHHCRLVDRGISLITLDVPDGGIPGEYRDSLLHLVDGTVASLPIFGPIGGSVTSESLVALLADIVATTAPTDLHALDLAATHGRDHSSHMFSASFVFWAAARLNLPLPLTWHRGYNVADEAVTLDGSSGADAATMLGYYEACADGCAPCGSSCQKLNTAHDTWLHRQYSSSRVLDSAGTLATQDGLGCVTDTLVLGDCAAAAVVTLDRGGQLTIADRCVASMPDGAVTLEACANVPAQYWVLDSEGRLWNGRMPQPGGDMSYDHVRCLSIDDGAVTAPTCGAHRETRWRFD